MKYCKECVYPYAAVNLMIDDDGVSAVANHLRLSRVFQKKAGKKKEKN